MGLEFFKVGDAHLNESIKNVRYMKRMGMGKNRRIIFTPMGGGGGSVRGRSIWTPVFFFFALFSVFFLKHF